MKILAIYPGFNPTVNDIAQALVHVAGQGHHIHVITAKRNKSKSITGDMELEQYAGLTIHRPFTTFFPEMFHPGSNKVQYLTRLVLDFEPDILLCSQEFTIHLGLSIKAKSRADIPVVVVSEFAGDLLDKGYVGISPNILYPLLGLPRGKKFWPWLCRNSDAVITCYPKDRQRLNSLNQQGTPVFFVPWCDQLPAGFAPAETKELDLAVYFGAFSQMKNTDAFRKMIPEILDNTPTSRIIFVGSGKTHVIAELKRVYGRHIEHILGLSRKDALHLLSQAFYGITPVIRGGWGFIGDCWAVKTPLVCMHNDYLLEHRKDALVGETIDALVQGIKDLYRYPSLYRLIQHNGYSRYRTQHTAEAVGNAYEQILTTIKLRKEKESK